MDGNIINIYDTIGNTPLIELSSFSTAKVKFYAKLEWFNPYGSVKDRAAYWMLNDAQKKGLLQAGHSVIIEPSSGNTGIALVGIAAKMGYKVEIVIPEKISEETKHTLRELGATLHETSDDLCPRVGSGTDQSIALAKAISKPRPDIYYMPNQYENDANFLAHYQSTGPEIWSQTNGKTTHLFVGCGTGGTITGTGTFLKKMHEGVQIIGIQPQKNHLIQGLRNFEESEMPELLKRRVHVVDKWITSSNQKSFDAVKDLASQEGLLVGPSSGAVMTAMLDFSKTLDKGFLVAIFADDGRKFKTLYTNQKIFTEEDFNTALHKSESQKLKYSNLNLTCSSGSQ